MPLVWPSHAPRRSAMLCWAPRGSGPMDRVSAYPRYPCGPSPPPPGRAVSMTAASCGDDANLRPCGARCIRKVSGDAQRHCQCCLVGSNERRHPVVPPGVHAGCWVPLCLSSSGMPVLCAPFPHGYTGCQGFPTERPRSWGSIRAMACPVPPWCDLSAAACYGGRCPSVPRGSGCSRRTCLKGGCAHTLLLRAAAASPASIERHAMVPPGGRVPSVPTRPTSRRYSLARIGSLGHANASA